MQIPEIYLSDILTICNSLSSLEKVGLTVVFPEVLELADNGSESPGKLVYDDDQWKFEPNEEYFK